MPQPITQACLSAHSITYHHHYPLPTHLPTRMIEWVGVGVGKVGVWGGGVRLFLQPGGPGGLAHPGGSITRLSVPVCLWGWGWGWGSVLSVQVPPDPPGGGDHLGLFLFLSVPSGESNVCGVVGVGGVGVIWGTASLGKGAWGLGRRKVGNLEFLFKSGVGSKVGRFHHCLVE